ncbi:MAG: hypothetical protein HKN47_00265 [Pirellulaceae bacterium]|nr:hypothetical protein [Pirellulaceae bacterium]
MLKETILNVFPGADDSHRLVVAIQQSAEGPSNLVLRQETFAADVGWFVQSRVAIEPCQVTGLKLALGSGSPHCGSPKSSVPRAKMPAQRVSASILPFSDALANQAS